MADESVLKNLVTRLTAYADGDFSTLFQFTGKGVEHPLEERVDGADTEPRKIIKHVSQCPPRMFQKPKAHGEILAVTFTNKATEEMTTRIINELAASISVNPMRPFHVLIIVNQREIV